MQIQKLFQSLAVLFAIGLQIQITLFANQDYQGLRLGLCDLVMPLLGLFIIALLSLKRTQWPKFSIPHTELWLAALLAVMSIALFQGYLTNGFLSNWALFNKYIGFVLLLAYLALGAWIGTNAPNYQKLTNTFASAFVSVFTLTAIASAIAVFALPVIGRTPWLGSYPWDALMGNRNAYMIAFVLSTTFVIHSYNEGLSIPVPIKAAFWAVLPIFFIFNASRTGWIIAALLFVLFLLKNPLQKLKSAIPFILIGIALAWGGFQVSQTVAVKDNLQGKFFINALMNNSNEYQGDMKRHIAFEDSLEMYWQNNPLLGAGLGHYKTFQTGKRGEFIDIIDSTPLWLLSETGLLGLLTFSAFFILCLLTFYKNGYKAEQGETFNRAAFLFLILFAGMTLLHELMYTRLLWFTVGLALTCSPHLTEPKKKS